MKPLYYCIRYMVIVCCLLCFASVNSYAQRSYATTNNTGNSGLLCLGCSVTAPGNAADGNVQTFAVINVVAGAGALSYEEVIFPASGGVAANTPVTVKLGTGNNLLDLTLLGSVYLQAYNGNTPIGARVAASTLVSALSGNNQVEVSISPAQTYDRLRVTLDGGLLGVASSIYLYDAFYGSTLAGCNTSIDELHGISSALLGLGLNVGGVVNPQSAIDGNLTTYSTLNAGVGVAGAYAQQTVIFQSPASSGDSVRLTIALPQTLLTAGVTANISATTFNGNTSNNDTQTLNSSLLNVRLLDIGGGITKVTITFAPTAVFDRVQLRLGGGIASALSTLNFYEAQLIIPAPIVKYNNAVVSGLQLCAGSSATLVANTAPNTTVSWYTQASGGTAVATGNNFTTPALSATATYYAAAAHPGCATESARTPVTITINQIPTAPVIANNSVTVCPGQQATFVANAVTGVTVNWYTAATGGTLAGTGNSFTTGALTNNTNYYAEAVSGGTCISPARTQVTAIVSPLPATPTLTAANVTICDGDVGILSIASPVAGVTYNWYATNTGGTILYTGVNFTTPALHNTTSYYAEAVNGNSCSSSQRVTGTVTVTPKPANPVLTTGNSTVVAGQTATITVSNAQTGVTYNWYTTASIATPIFTGTTFQTPALYTTTTYYVSGVNSSGCTSVNRVPVTINVTINNNSPCTFANTQTSNVSGGACVLCSVTNNALATDADTTTASTLNITAGLIGAYTEQQLVFQQPGFIGDTIRIGLQSSIALASAGVLGQIQVTLYNGATQVSQYTLDNNLIKVSLLGGGGNRYNVYIPATGTYDRVTVRLMSGTASTLSALQLYYALQQYPKPTFTPANPEICSGGTAQINITSPATGTYSFYSAPTGGSPLYTGTSFTTPALTANTTYYIEYNRNGCLSPVRYPVNILINSAPANATVTPTTATIYSGQTATFNATAPNNATVNWYTAATGGTAVFTGNTFTTPALSANTDYYAETALGTCVSPTRTHVNVVVNPVIIPDIAVNPPTQTVNAGTAATLTASSTTPGTVFNWYTQPTGGISIYTGATLTTPAIFANTTYYAEAKVTATGAVSTTRASGVINVNTLATNPTPCDAAIDQTTGNSGVLCVNCIVNNATGSVDADRNTFAQLNVLAGVVNAYTQQTLRFANTGHAGDSVIVEMGVPGSLANAGVLSQISVATYNGTTYNNDRFNVNGSLINVSLLNGTSTFRIAFPATADFDRVEIRLNSSIAGLLNSLNVYDAAQEVAPPVVTASTVTVCQGSQATLTATVPNYVTVKWYTSATGGAPIFTGAVFNTPALAANTTYYAEASRTADGCAQTVRTPVNVTVTPIPAAPVVNTPTVTVCAGQPATFAAAPVSGVTYNWYSAAAGGTSLFTGANFTTGNLATTTSYYVEASNGSCNSSARTQVTANVNPAVVDPSVAQTTVNTCSGTSAVLTAMSSQSGVSFNWYTAATGGTPVFTGAQYTTPALTANTTYYVEASSGTCTSPDRIAVNVTVNPTPTAPTLTTVPSNGQIASGQTASITASSTTAGATFNWYTAASGGTPIFTGSTFTTPALTSNTTYYAESALATGCISARTLVTITVNPIFSTTCDFASTQTTDVNGGALCVGCTVTNPNYSVDADITNYSTLNIVAGVAGSYVSQSLIFAETGNIGDTVSVRLHFPVNIASAGAFSRIRISSFNGSTYNNDGLFLNDSQVKVQVLTDGQTAIIKFAPQTTFDRVEVRINSALVSTFNSLDIGYASKQVEAPQLAANTANICAGSTATFTVSNARAGVTYDWYSTAIGGTSLHTGTTFTTPALSATSTYYVQSSRTVNTCPNPNRVAATANVTPAPLTPILAQASVQLCAGDNVILTVTNAGAATVNWYDAATGGNLVFTGVNFQVSPLVNINYYAELTNGTCTSPSRAQAMVTVNPRPAKPGVQSANVTVCTGSPAILQVLTPETGVTYDWFTAATGGASVFTGASFTTPAITQNTSYYIQATATAGGCINNGGRTQVNINTNGVIANPALSAATTQVCNGGSASISVQNPVNGITYKWYTAATGGTLAFSGTTFTLNNLTVSASYFVEASNSAGCASAGRTETDIVVLPIPNAPTIQALVGGSGVCQGASASLSINNPQSGQVYNWYNAPTGGTLLFSGTQFNTPALTVNTTYYIEAVMAGNCNPSPRTAVTINVNALPADPALMAANVSVCAGSSAIFTIASPQAGVSYQWYDSSALTNLLFTGTQFVTGALTANTTYYVAAINTSGCQANNLATAQVTIQALPGAPIIANGSTIQDCSGSAVTLTISNPIPGYTYNWYNAATGGTLVATGTSFTTAALTNNTIYYAEAVSATGCVSSTRTSVTINVNPLPATPVIANGNSVQSCSGSAVTLTISNPVAGVTYNWYSAATGGSIVATGTSFTTSGLTASTTYYAEAVSASGCVSFTRTPVTINVNLLPSAPVIANGNTVQSCSGSAVTLTISNPAAGVIYNWYDAVTGGTLVSTGTSFTISGLTASTTYYAEGVSAAGCASSTRTAVTININPLPSAPVIANGNSVQSCSGSPVALTISNPVAGVTYNWYDAVTGGTLVSTGTSFTTSGLTASTTYYAEGVSAAGCASSTRTPVTININPLPSAPVIANGNTVQSCSGSAVTLTISNPVAGVYYNWYSVATGGTSVATGTSFTTAALTANTTYYAEAVSAAGCISSTRTSVTINVNPLPLAPVIANGSTVQSCSGSSVTLTISNPVAGVTYNWYSAATGGSSVASGTSFTTANLTANTTYYAEAVSAAGCISSTRTSVTINVNQAPATPIIANGNSVQSCSGSPVTLTISNPVAGVTYNWYSAATGGSSVASGTSFTTAALTTSTSYYTEAVSSAGCTSSTRTPVTINVNPLPSAPVIANGNTVQSCSGSAVTLTISNPVAGVTYNWYSTATGGSSAATGTSFTTANLTANTTYYAEAVSAAGCVSSTRTPVTINVNQAPATPIIANGNSVQSCLGSPVTLTISNPVAGVTYNWYSAATGGTSVATGTSFTTPGLTASTTYCAEAVSASGCVSSTRTPVTINVNPAPAIPVIANGNTVQDCAGSAVTLTISNPVAGVTYNWYDAATGGNLMATGTSFTTQGLNASVIYYAGAVNAAGCTSTTRAAVLINVNQPLAPPTVTVQGATGAPTACAGSSATLNATSAASNVTFNWYNQANGGAIIFTGATFTTGPLNANATYYVEAAGASGTCVSARTGVSILVVTPPATPVPVAATVNTCMGSPATLAVSSPGAGITYNWYDSASMTNLLYTGSTYTTGAVNANTTYYVNASNGSCSSSSLAAVQVIVNPLPAAPLVVSSNVSSCANSRAVLSIANPQGGFSYNWYSTASGSTSLYTGTNFTTPQLTASTTYYAEAVNSTGCPSAARTAINVSISPAPAAPIVNAPGNNVCAGGSITLSAATADPNITISWYAAATGGTALATGNTFTTPVLNADVTYYAEAMSTAGGCVSATRTPVAIVVKQPLTAPVVTVQSTTASTVTFQWNGVSGAAGYLVSLDKGVTFITPGSGANGTTHTVSGLNPNQTVYIIVKALGSSGCQLSVNSASTPGTATNPLGDDIFVPNAFTPNGDGNNDVLYVYGHTISSLNFMVYDQYGQLLLKAVSQATGWDGTYRGQRQPVGVYVYMLQATLTDGRIITKKGSITLLR